MRRIRLNGTAGRAALAALALLFVVAACSDLGQDASGSLAESPAAETAVTSEEGSEPQGAEGDSGKTEGADAPGEEGAAQADNAREDAGGEDAELPAQPAPDDVPEKEIVVCLEGAAPDLFLYGDDSLSATALRHALNENIFTSMGYEYQAQGLEKLPSLADGDARLVMVTANEGDRVVDEGGNIVVLRKGVTVTDYAGEAVPFAGEPIDMAQMEVDFTFKPLVWSDGTPVSSVDSVFSFNVASDPQTNNGKLKTGYTERYEATGDLDVRWTGLPGFLDQTYFTNVWSPLPAHALSRYTAVELAAADEVTKQPLSSGPYVVSEWQDADSLVLSANPHYYRAAEGAPLVEQISFRFGSIEDLIEEEAHCDVLAGGALGGHNLPELEENGALDGWEILTSAGNVYEQIAFGIVPVSEYHDSRPDWFGDVRVRRALALCTDRERMAGELLNGKGEMLETLAPSDHPLAPDDLTAWTYDPSGGNSLLDEAGFLDHAEDGRRQDVASGVPMTVTLGTNSESALRTRITEIFQENMAACGFPVTLYDRPAGTWFGPGPQGPVFGRQFDLAAFAWLGHVNPDCTIFSSDNIPGPVEFDFGGWSAPNVSGWSDEAYDAACGAAVRAMPGGEGYEENMSEALRIFNEQLPALPLFTNYKAVAVRPGIENVRPDPTQPSALWNIADWNVAD